MNAWEERYVRTFFNFKQSGVYKSRIYLHEVTILNDLSPILVANAKCKLVLFVSELQQVAFYNITLPDGSYKHMETMAKSDLPVKQMFGPLVGNYGDSYNTSIVNNKEQDNTIIQQSARVQFTKELLQPVPVHQMRLVSSTGNLQVSPANKVPRKPLNPNAPSWEERRFNMNRSI